MPDRAPDRQYSTMGADLSDSSKGASEVETWMSGMANFFVEQGKFTREEMDKTLKSGFVNDKFLKLAAEMK